MQLPPVGELGPSVGELNVGAKGLEMVSIGSPLELEDSSEQLVSERIRASAHKIRGRIENMSSSMRGFNRDKQIQELQGPRT
jgi:hypothetical protein